MTAIPPPDVTIASLIDRAHESKRERPRPHLGCSEAGHACERWLWLKFRWAVIEGPETFRYNESLKSKPGNFDSYGQLLRLFRRGHHEEDWMVYDLESIGCAVSDRQSRVVFSAHVSGSVDGTLTGLHGAEKTNHILEGKTSGLAAFKKIVKDGCLRAKPLHEVQQQMYMLGSHSKDTWQGSDPPKCKRSFYHVSCKDNDSLYTERLRFDRERAEYFRDRAIRISESDEMPAAMGAARADWYECKMCPGHEFCFKNRLTKEVNCRTCAHSTATKEGWHCARWDDMIPLQAQYNGCDFHVLHPDLTPWELVASDSDWIGVYIIDGQRVQTGNPDAHVVSSKELVENASEAVRKLKEGM